MRQFMSTRYRNSLIPYGTSSPTALPNKTGAVSPLGWTVDFFDDFTGTFTLTTSANWNVGANQIFTTGATYLGSPAQYGCFFATSGWGGYGPQVDNLNRVSMSGSNLIMGGTLVGGVPQVGSALMNFNTCWGYWEVNMKQASAANGVQTDVGNGIWLVGEPNWPQNGEFDVIENANGAGGYNSFIHCGPTAGSDHLAFSSNAAALPDGSHWYDGGYHTYGALITPSYLAMYIDGVRQWTTSIVGVLNNLSTSTTPPSGSAAGSFGYQAVGLSPDLRFSSDFFCLIFGLNWGSTSSAAQFPLQVQVDWIRHSALNPATGGPHV